MNNRRWASGVRALAAAAALAGMAGCGAVSQSLAANKRSPGKLENGVFKPDRPAQANYGPDPALTCPEHGVNGLVAASVTEQAPKDKPAPKADGRLCAIADTLLGWPYDDKNKELPPERVRAFLSQYFGEAGTARNIGITVADTEDEKSIAATMVEPIISFAGSAHNPRYGLMTQRIKKGQTRVVLVMIDENMVIDPPLPRKLAPNTNATFSGHLVGVAKDPKIQIVDVVGKLDTPKIPPGQEFKAGLACGDRPGKILVQVVADVEGSDALIANFPVWCAAEPDQAVQIGSKQTGVVDPAQAEQKLLELINADRTAAGLKPLKLNNDLSDIARHLSTQRAAGKGTSSTEISQALKAKDIRAPLLLESQGQVLGGPEDAFQRFSESPNDRANEMSADMTEIGVGVAKGPEIGSKPSIIVTELFVKQLPPPDAASIKAKLYEAIARKRADARAPALAKDPVLEDVAQKYAEAAAANNGQVPSDKQQEILAPLYKSSMTVNQLGGFVLDEANAMDIAEQPSVVGNSKLVGLGVAVGTSPQFGKNSPFVMVLLGTRHAPPKAAPKRRRHH